MSKTYDEILADQAADLAKARATIMNAIGNVGDSNRGGEWWDGMTTALIAVVQEERTVVSSLPGNAKSQD